MGLASIERKMTLWDCMVFVMLSGASCDLTRDYKNVTEHSAFALGRVRTSLSSAAESSDARGTTIKTTVYLMDDEQLVRGLQYEGEYGGGSCTCCDSGIAYGVAPWSCGRAPHLFLFTQNSLFIALFPANKISQDTASTDTVQKCQAKCAAMPDCAAFEWYSASYYIPSFANSCVLKSAPTECVSGKPYSSGWVYKHKIAGPPSCDGGVKSPLDDGLVGTSPADAPVRYVSAVGAVCPESGFTGRSYGEMEAGAHCEADIVHIYTTSDEGWQYAKFWWQWKNPTGVWSDTVKNTLWTSEMKTLETCKSSCTDDAAGRYCKHWTIKTGAKWGSMQWACIHRAPSTCESSAYGTFTFETSSC